MRLLGVVFLAGCVPEGSTPLEMVTDSPRVRVDSSLVASAIVTPDPSRTYEYERAGGATDSILQALWGAGLPVAIAWRPEAYICLDVIGPRLTVELTVHDDRMAQRGFSLGTGRLGCSNRVWEYVLVAP